MNAIPIKPVMMKGNTQDLSKALGISEYANFSRIAAIPTIASIQPIPEPKP